MANLGDAARSLGIEPDRVGRERASRRKGGPTLKARFLLRLDDTTYEVLRNHAHRTHTPMTVIVRDAIRAYLKDQL